MKISPNLFIFLVVLTLCLTVSYAIVYTGIQSFSQDSLVKIPDAAKYLALYHKEQVIGHWRWRVLVPFLARTLPDLPGHFFSENREATDLWMARVKFGIVNFAFLSATGVLFFYFLGAFGFFIGEALLGVMLFYTARPVIQFTGIPMTDAAGYFFLLLCFFGLLRKDLALLTAGFFAGIFARETVFLAFPACLLLPDSAKFKIKACSVMVLIFLGYCVFRFYIFPDSGENYFNLPLVLSPVFQAGCFSKINRLLDLFSSFGPVWFFAFYALFLPKLPVLLRKWSWLIVIVLFIAGSAGRILFPVFPLVIPLALFGIRQAIRFGQ